MSATTAGGAERRPARGCRSCEGRGWRLAGPVQLLPVEETTVRLARRPCPDCAGASVDQDTGGR
jgi:hypothetical protein